MEKDKYHNFTHMWNLKKTKRVNKQDETRIDLQRENRLVISREGGSGEGKTSEGGQLCGDRWQLDL